MKDNKKPIIHYYNINGVNGRKSRLVEYLISQGINIEVIESAGELRGMSIEHIIIDECVDSDGYKEYTESLTKEK